tara:strand:- start:1379 stop:2200 length:822 start_codon:yes stop_codon:yes gene_type:complete
MIKLFIYALLAIVTGLLTTLFLAREPGYLLVSFAEFTFETSLFALFVASIAVLILLRLLVLIFDWINPLRLFSASRRWSAARLQAANGDSIRDALYEELSGQRSGESTGVLSGAELRKVWKRRAKQITPDDDLISVYVEALVQCDALDEALKVLENALQGAASEILVRQYSLLSLRLNDTDAAQQLQRAEAWLDSRPKDAQLLLALGRISLRNRVWGKAREYFERSLREHGNPEVFAELARLLHNLKEQGRSSRFLEAEIKLISQSLPNFPQP